MPYHHKVAFRCKGCGHLVAPEHAGENLLPHSCPVCKAGVQFNIDPSAKGRFDEIIAKMSKMDTPQLEREQLATELAALPREKQYFPDNWEVLHGCHPDRIKELGLDPDDVVEYKPARTTKPSQGRVVRIEASEGTDVADGSAVKVGHG